MRYLGIDYGTKKIGLAIGDDETKIASPLDVATSIDDVVQMIREEGIDAIVVGIPMSVGEFHSSDQLDITKGFVDLLKQKIELPVHVIDERHTTAEANRLIDEQGAQAEEDALAAMIILQAYFDEMK